jgi:uncharacterized protein (TIGR02996 family)
VANELDALVAAVLAAPDDDGPRLVLADYLIERGDPRGELIVVQCKLARSEHDVVLRAEELGLLVQLSPPNGTTVTYDRGFVAAAKFKGWFGGETTTFLTAEPLLRKLTIDCNYGGGDAKWTSIGELIAATMSRLTYLELENVIWVRTDMWGGNPTEFDEAPQCAAMFARLPPRPTALTDLVVPANVSLPAHWAR